MSACSAAVVRDFAQVASVHVSRLKKKDAVPARSGCHSAFVPATLPFLAVAASPSRALNPPAPATASADTPRSPPRLQDAATQTPPFPSYTPASPHTRNRSLHPYIPPPPPRP